VKPLRLKLGRVLRFLGCPLAGVPEKGILTRGTGFVTWEFCGFVKNFLLFELSAGSTTCGQGAFDGLTRSVEGGEFYPVDAECAERAKTRVSGCGMISSFWDQVGMTVLRVFSPCGII